MNTWNYGELQEKDSKTDTLYNIQFKNWHVEKDLIQSMTRCKVIYSKFGNFKKHKKKQHLSTLWGEMSQNLNILRHVYLQMY